MAKLADLSATAATNTVVTKANILPSKMGKVWTTLSAKPMI